MKRAARRAGVLPGCLLSSAAVTISIVMSAPQLTDPGASGEWLRTGAEDSGPASTVRRQRFTRMVSYAMAGLTAFTLLGLGCFAWRRHTLKAELEAPPPATAPAVAAAPLAPVAAAAPPPAAEPAPVAAPAPAPAPSPATGTRRPSSKKALASASAPQTASKKKPARSPFLKTATR